ncbi:hypothetical protein BKA66DRAFT_249707 [Pyrenochaeta sp. MPI-SDFR-AT-0127]|nr:hypothetical protein BKA66DRAFT_249707 [Pyrenochaeta sp. MPI-SDFR-AT-0127]
MLPTSGTIPVRWLHFLLVGSSLPSIPGVWIYRRPIPHKSARDLTILQGKDRSVVVVGQACSLLLASPPLLRLVRFDACSFKNFSRQRPARRWFVHRTQICKRETQGACALHPNPNAHASAAYTFAASCLGVSIDICKIVCSSGLAILGLWLALLPTKHFRRRLMAFW